MIRLGQSDRDDRFGAIGLGRSGQGAQFGVLGSWQFFQASH